MFTLVEKSEVNDITYYKMGSVVLSASSRHEFVKLTILDGFPMKMGMIRPLTKLGKYTLYGQYLMRGREWTLTTHGPSPFNG
jgi:hypothetical protein